MVPSMIEAKIIKHSKSSVNGQEIITYELTYPRMIHSEFLTHRLFSRNAASSRAIPIDTLIKLVREECAMPSEWGLNQSGMQAKGIHTNPQLCKETWLRGAERAIQTAEELKALGLHKQICNRPLEPFQCIKTVVTATEWNNWFWLRNHEAADPTIQELARKMLEAKEVSIPQILNPDEYHLPYVDSLVGLSLDEAIKISVSCCAQVSYRKLDDSMDKAERIYDMLLNMDRVHASPFEHIATPMEFPNDSELNSKRLSTAKRYMSKGEHLDNEGNFWSGNFKGWYQYRQEISNNTKW